MDVEGVVMGRESRGEGVGGVWYICTCSSINTAHFLSLSAYWGIRYMTMTMTMKWFY